jgi:hypothetical protein
MRERPIIEYDVRTYDTFGECQDVESFDSLHDATRFFNSIAIDNEVAGVEVEKHTTRYTPRESIYKSLKIKGDIHQNN